MKAKVQNKKKVFCKQNIPNMLVVFRMVIAVAIVTLILCETYGIITKDIYVIKDLFVMSDDDPKLHANYCGVSLLMLISACLFAVACISDWLDGFLARKYHWISDFGKFWDPVADKVLVNSVMIAFAWHCFIPIWIPIVMIARDILVDADRMVAAKKNIVVAANIYGKAKTVLQMVGLIFIFFICQGTDYTHHLAMWWGVQNFIMYAATLMSVISGIIYFREINKLKKHGKQN